MNGMMLGLQEVPPSSEMCSPFSEPDDPLRGDLRPRAIVFDGCAGWLHPAVGSHGVILCGPVGQEELATHSGWRSLACQLAESGVTTLRFDYPGTGDSAGAEEDPDRLSRWVDSVVAAADWIRRYAGVERIDLVGLRLGAVVAALAAPRIGQVDRLVCLNPVISGRQYLRELRLLASTWWAQAAPNPRPLKTPAGCYDVIGYRWDPASAAALAAIDLSALPDWPRAVILMDSTGRPDVAGLATSLRARGVAVSQQDFPGAAAFLRDALLTVVPQQAFDTLCTLLRGAREEGVPAEIPRMGRSLGVPAPRLDVEGSVESPIAFGPEGKLHGVLCRPSEVAAAPGPALLILNTGLTHHVGHARLNVLLARGLARIGVTSLRMDGAGIGDSDIPRDYPSRLLHDNRARPGIVEALDTLERLGHRDITVMGLCSGGYLAFHTALIDRRIGCVIAINTQKFYWAGGPSFNVTHDGNRRATAVYLRASLNWRNWSRAMRGEVRVARIITDLARRIMRKWGHSAMQRVEAVTGRETRAGQVARWIRTLSAHDVRVRLIYSDADPGLADLCLETNPFALMRTLPALSLEVVANADHTLSSISARDEVVSRLINHFAERQAGKTVA